MPSAPRLHPTIIDLARIAGVSKSTVSAALLDNHCIALATREKVRKVALRMGYVPNLHAAALATREKKRLVSPVFVAIVSHFPKGESLGGYHCRPIENRLRELGYEGHHFDLQRDKISARSLRKLLYSRGYCAIIFDQIRDPKSEIFSMDWEPFSLVASGRTYAPPGCDLVRSDFFRSITLTWQEVRKAGYRRIGFLLGRHRPIMLDDMEREGALAVCQADLGPGEEAIPPFLGSIPESGGVAKWYRRHRPDAVVGFNGMHLKYLLEMGVRIPQDVGYADLHQASESTGVAGIDPREEEARAKTAEHIDMLVRHKRTGLSDKPWEILASPRWLSGSTLPYHGEGRLNPTPLSA